MFDPKDMNTINANGTAYGGSSLVILILVPIFLGVVVAGIISYVF